jgi:FAD synthase
VVDVSFVRGIRPEKRFSGVEELKEQIARDVEEARRITNDTI